MKLEMGQTPALPPYPAVVSKPLSADAPSLRVRLAQVILDLAECAEIDVANSIFLTEAISNNRLAALAGGRPKTVARMIEHFKLRGLVETRRERFIIRQPARLRAVIARTL